MFINAEPRIAPNGFEAFVPFHRAELMHQRLVEMTNNNVNAWSVCRPVASSTSSIWDQQMDDFGNENFSVNQFSKEKMQVELMINRFKALMLDTSKNLPWPFQDRLSNARRLLRTPSLTSPSASQTRIRPLLSSHTKTQHLI
jgi:hypothetical protein